VLFSSSQISCKSVIFVHIKDTRILFFCGKNDLFLSVFESRVLSVMLKHKGELITGGSSKFYYGNFHDLCSSSSLGWSGGTGMQ
jgi:hypothetical protein